MSPRSIKVIAACAVLILSACQKDPAGQDNEPTVLPAQQWLEALSANAEIFDPPSQSRFPDDFQTHPQSRAESFLLQVILQPDNAAPVAHENWLIGMIAQIDRLTINGTDDVPGQSLWQFREVLRSVVLSDAAFGNTVLSQAMTATEQASSSPAMDVSSGMFENLATSVRTQHVQRASVGLAGRQQNTVWVLGNRMTHEATTNSESLCSRRYLWRLVLAATEQAELSMDFEDCPQPGAFGDFNNWQQTSTMVSGTLASSANPDVTASLDVSGFAWMSQTWGNLPTSSGAVVFDTVQLRLDDNTWLDVSRSKRRSGSGPKTVSATSHSDTAQAGSMNLVWRDAEELATVSSGNRYPRSILLENDERSMVLSITPLNRFEEIVEFGEHRLRVPVTVEGTHSGSGFLSYTHLGNR